MLGAASAAKFATAGLWATGAAGVGGQDGETWRSGWGVRAQGMGADKIHGMWRRRARGPGAPITGLNGGRPRAQACWEKMRGGLAVLPLVGKGERIRAVSTVRSTGGGTRIGAADESKNCEKISRMDGI